MNRILIAFTAGMLLLAGDGFAAETTATIEVARSIAEAERKAIVADNMFFTPEEAEKFWPVYNEYREEERKVGDKRVKVIRDLAKEFETLDDAPGRVEQRTRRRDCEAGVTGKPDPQTLHEGHGVTRERERRLIERHGHERPVRG